VGSRSGLGVSPRLQRAGTSWAGQHPGGQIRLGLDGVGDADHRGGIGARRTSVVYHAARR